MLGDYDIGKFKRKWDKMVYNFSLRENNCGVCGKNGLNRKSCHICRDNDMLSNILTQKVSHFFHTCLFANSLL